MARWTPRDPHQFICGAVAGIGVATLGVLAWPTVKKLFTGPETSVKRLMGDSVEERCVLHVFKAAHKGDAASVIKAIDEFCWKEGFMMNLGDVKGTIVKKEVAALKAPRLCIEFGGYCGYSAILIGSTLPAGCKFISIEINPVYAALATKLIEFAGLKDRVTVMVADVPDALKEIRAKFGAGAADLVFIDHWKTIYLRDMKNLEASGLLRLGSVVVADNILYPGAPDYLEYVQRSKRYRTVLHKTLLEYHTDREDAVAVSTVVSDSA